MVSLREELEDSIHRSTDSVEAMGGTHKIFNRYRGKNDDKASPSQEDEQEESPRALASQALYAERGSDEGTADYESRRRAQARFVQQHLRYPVKVEESSNNSPLSYTGTEGYDADVVPTRSATQGTAPFGRQRLDPRESHAIRMAQIQSRMTRHKPPHFRTNGPPPPIQVGESESEGEHPGSSSEEEAGTPRQPAIGQGSDPDPGTAYAPLDQDYARRSMGALHVQSLARQAQVPGYAQQTAHLRQPMPGGNAPNLMQQMQLIAPLGTPQPGNGHMEADHEAHMINNLVRHIRDSLMGIPDNLPEIKGLRARMPEAYGGEDDFDRLDNWLQGLLRYFKIHRLTGVDRDEDRVLVTGTSLKGKAERWFSQEVERPTRIIRNWTFESVIIGLFRAFITTATAQQAMQHYVQIRFSREDGVTAFYRELLMWAGRLAQYPDPYSFKRRLLNGMPPEYRHHLALYDGISAEHSTIDEIVRRARKLEKTLVLLKTVRIPDRNPQQGTASPAISGVQRQDALRNKRRSRTPPTKQSQGKSSATAERSGQRSSTRANLGTRGNAAEPNNATAKGDTSKLTCYRCGKAGHISSDPKCPQYKKPEQRQLFAAQVVDDRSEGEHLDSSAASGTQGEGEYPADEESPAEEHESCPETGPDGPQYTDEDPPYEEYDGYDSPSEEDEPVYIRAMHEEETGASAVPTQFDDASWQDRRNAIRLRYQRAPWMLGDTWEFTPRDGITHQRGCDKCASYKEHILRAEALEETKGSSAWDTRNQYEQDLIRLGWTLAHEGRRVPHDEASAATLGAYNEALERQNHSLKLLAEASRRRAVQLTTVNNELREDLECERLDASLRAGEAALWLDEYQHLQKRYTELEKRLLDSLQKVAPPMDDDVDMTLESPPLESPLSAKHPLSESVGEKSREPITGSSSLFDEANESQLEYIDAEAVARIAAARDEPHTQTDREFRAAQRYKCPPGERPRTNGLDRRCMAALVKVNGLEAYALLDSGSTTVSITHDFARVAELKVVQLENPVALQLGTVGSRSMINYGARTSVNLGPVHETDAYLDVVNIDRYDMIIGTPFMRRHGLVLDFERGTLSARGQTIQTLSAGQEDLTLAKKRANRARAPKQSGERRVLDSH